MEYQKSTIATANVNHIKSRIVNRSFIGGSAIQRLETVLLRWEVPIL